VEGIEKSGVKEEALNRAGVGRRGKSLALINLSKAYRKVLISEKERNYATISSMMLLVSS